MIYRLLFEPTIGTSSHHFASCISNSVDMAVFLQFRVVEICLKVSGNVEMWKSGPIRFESGLVYNVEREMIVQVVEISEPALGI